MSFTQRLVQPKLPTLLADSTHVDLPGQDIWPVYADSVHIVPTRLDVPKFEDALSRVMQVYPHTAGRFRGTDGRWFIELTNSGVPMDIEYKLGMSTDSFLNGNWVLQDGLSPLLNKHPIGVNSVNGDSPLLRLKVTLFDEETCIGVTWNHSLGDGIVISRFIHTLSQFYQGLPSEFALPTFKKYHYPTPSSANEPSSHVTRHLDETSFIKPARGSGHVTWQIDTHDLENLRSALSSDGQNKRYVSKHDCLTAYFVALLNRVKSKPVKTVINSTSYRHVNAPFVDENVAGNLIMRVSASVPMDMAGIAVAIRGSLVRCREPSCIQILESSKSEHMIKSAKTGKPTLSAFNESVFAVDSHVVIDWCRAHFGCPNGTRFYTCGLFVGLLRSFKSNPVKGKDGVWQARDAIDISLGVSAELNPKILENLARGIQYMLDDQHVQL